MGEDTNKFERCVGRFKERHCLEGNLKQEHRPNHGRIARMMGTNPDQKDVRKSTFDEYFTSKIWTTTDRHNIVYMAIIRLIIDYIKIPYYKYEFERYQKAA